MKPMKAHRIRIFILCWIAYAIAYLCRNNLSIALPIMSDSLGFTKAQLGLLGSLFFWVYGIGQLINGSIGDKIPTVPFISLGLLVSGIMNISLGLSENIVIMCIIWGVNGYFLSMLWGPIMKTLSEVFSQNVRSQVAVGMSTSMVVGFLMAWGLIGWLLVYLDWVWAFFIPGIVMILFAICFYILMSRTISPHTETHKESKKSKIPFKDIFIETKMHFVVITCMAQGIIKDGISFWAPMLLIETHNLDFSEGIGYILFIPLANLLGMYISNRLNKKFFHREKITVVILFSASIAFFIVLIITGSIHPILTILPLGLASGMLYGSNTVLLGVIPLAYKKYDRTSSVAGFLDFSSYLAAGIFALVSGILVANLGWNLIFIFWIAMAILGGISILWSIKNDLILENKPHRKESQYEYTAK